MKQFKKAIAKCLLLSMLGSLLIVPVSMAVENSLLAEGFNDWTTGLYSNTALGWTLSAEKPFTVNNSDDKNKSNYVTASDTTFKLSHSVDEGEITIDIRVKTNEYKINSLPGWLRIRSTEGENLTQFYIPTVQIDDTVTQLMYCYAYIDKTTGKSTSKYISTTDLKPNEWYYIRQEINLKSKKVNLYYGENIKRLKPWTTEGSSFELSSDPDEQDNIASLRMKNLTFDDVAVYHGDTPPKMPTPKPTPTPAVMPAPSNLPKNGTPGNVKSDIFVDVKGTVYEDAVRLLAKLDILKGVSAKKFNPDDNITRRDFTVAIIRALGLAVTAEGTGDAGMFSDVKKSDSAYNSINLAYKLKLINGVDNKKFYPNNLITYEQAVKIIVSALGYDRIALSRGGYPTGYYSIASEKKLTKSIAVPLNGEAKRGVIAQLLCNALTIDLLAPLSYGNKVEYQQIPGQNLLTERLGVKKLKGQVTAIGSTSISYSAISISKDEVAIDDIIYKVGDTNVSGLLGHFVSFYVKEDSNGDDKAILLIQKDDDKYNVLSLNQDVIWGAEQNSLSFRIAYSENSEKDNRKEAVLAPNINVVKNGRLLSRVPTKEDFKPSYGKVELFDYDDNNTFELAIITDYKVVVVDTVNTIDNKVFFKNNKTLNNLNYIELDPGSSNYKFTLAKDNEPIEIKNLNELDVLSVAADDDFAVINIVASSTKIEGRVEELNDGDDSKNIVIGGKRYKVNPYFYSNNSGSLVGKVAIGDTGSFLTDIDGKIVASHIISSAGGAQYGVIIASGTGTGISPKGELKLLNSAGEVVVLTCQEKLQLDNGVNIQRMSSSAASSYITQGLSGGSIKRLIKYTLNQDEEINRIDLAVDLTLNTPNEQKFALNYSGIPAISNISTIRTISNILRERFVISGDTKIFYVPYDVSDTERYGLRSLSLINELPARIDVYDANSNYTPGAVVIMGSQPANSIYIDEGVNSIFVDRISDAVDDNGDVVKKLYGINDTGKKGENAIQGWKIAKDIVPVTQFNGVALAVKTISDIKRGDLILFSKNINNEINKITIIFSSQNLPSGFYEYVCDNYKNENAVALTDGAAIYGNNYYVDERRIFTPYGVVRRSISNTHILINAHTDGTDPKWDRLIAISSATRVYLYNSKNQTIYETMPSSIQPGDKVFIKAMYNYPRDIVIIR